MREALQPLLRKSLAAAAATLTLAGLLGCGGGDELAPPVPVGNGSGLASVVLGGVDLGSTIQVESSVSEFRETAVAVMDELVTFEGDPPVAVLANRDLAPDLSPCDIIVESVASPGIFYTPGGEFTVDFVAGTFTANMMPGGGYFIADGTEVRVSYCTRIPVFKVVVGVGLETGDTVNIDFYNIPGGVSGMRQTSALSTDFPGDGSFTFNMQATQDLTEFGPTRFVLLDEPAQNDATVISADLTNQLNPCIEGRVVGLMRNQDTSEDVLLEVDFDDPDCPS